MPTCPAGALAALMPENDPFWPSMTAPARRSKTGHLYAVRIVEVSRYVPCAKQNVVPGAFASTSAWMFELGVTLTPTHDALAAGLVAAKTDANVTATHRSAIDLDVRALGPSALTAPISERRR